MPDDKNTPFDYTHVDSRARIALYDDLKSAPRITIIEPAPTTDYIGQLAATVYEQAHQAGGNISYTTILEVSENFIHAQFKEVVVSILDNGNTIRFADQGPGITDKEKAQQPGFSSAIEPMKHYIRGVGSGLPIVKEWLDNSDGTIVIEDNLNSGAVVTISLVNKPQPTSSTTSAGIGQPTLPRFPLSERQANYMRFLLKEGDLGVTEMHHLTGDGFSTISNNFGKLQEFGLIEQLPNKKRTLTTLGQQVATSI